MQKQFYINGQFLIDQDLRLTNCDIRMGPGATILCSGGHSITIEDTHIWGCSELWNEILIDGQNSNISVINSLIEDGTNAVHCNKGGEYFLSNAVFNKNYRSLYLTNAGIGTVKSSLFTSLDLPSTSFIDYHTVYYESYITTNFSTMYAGGFTTGYLKFPHSGAHPYCGIEIVDDAQGRTIGDASSAGLLNIFDNMRFGIIAFQSSKLKIVNNLFWRIHIHNTSIKKEYAAIWNRKARELTVGAANTNEFNRFYDCQNGVLSYSTDFNNIDYNKFENGDSFIRDKYGILLQLGNKPHNSILKNQMTGMNYGIYCSFITDGWTRILNNTIDVRARVEGDFQSSQMFSFGIMAAKCNFPLNNTYPYTTTLTIDENIINIRNVGMGISSEIAGIGIHTSAIVAQKFFYVQSNKVTFTEPYFSENYPSYGIWLHSSINAEIKHNKVETDWAIPNFLGATFHESYGMSVDNFSHNAKVFLNDVQKFKDGISAWGNNFPSQFGCNKLWKNYNGFMFFNANIGDQLLGVANGTQNNWDDGTGSSLNSFDIIGTTPLMDWFWYGYQPIAGTSNMSFPPTSGYMDCENVGTGMSPSALTVAGRELSLGKIVRGENMYDTLNTEFLTRDSIFCFKRLVAYDTLLHLGTADDTVYQNFYNYCNNHNIGKFTDVDIALIDTLFIRFDDALLKNQNIITKNTPEENDKAVNEIYIRKLKYESDSLNTEGNLYEFDSLELSILENVAYQNPILGGSAVYLARVLLWIVVRDDKWQSAERKSHPAVKEDERFAFKLYPNPGNGSFTLSYTLQVNEQGEFGIYTLGGMTIKNYNFGPNQNMLSINETGLSSGAYLYGIWVNGVLRKMDRLVIVK